MEYYEDHFEKNPNEARKALSKDGEFHFANTGDPLFDKWEEEMSKGLVPDLEEGMHKDTKEKLRKEREKYGPTVPTQANTPPLHDAKYNSKSANELKRSGVGSIDTEWVDLLGEEDG